MPPAPEDLRQIWRQEPMLFKQAFWPDIQFYTKQVEILCSVRDNIETYVHAGNMLGKDYVAGFIALWYLITNYYSDSSQHWIRIITTSVKDEHLDVLWAEIAKFASSSQVPILYGLGGPWVMTHHEMRHVDERDRSNPGNYLKGMVSSPDKKEGLQGHHAVNNLLIVDEASGVNDWVYEMGQGWAKKMFIFGNPNPTTNFFYRGCKAGDLLA